MKLIEKRNIFYIISLILVTVGIVSLFTRHLNAGIDFRGGTSIQVKATTSTTVADVRAVLAVVNVEKDAEIQQSQDQFIIRTRAVLDDAQTNQLKAALTAKNMVYQSKDTVGAVIGKELWQNAIWEVLLACAFILIYISFRFEWKFGVAAIAAEVHDVLLVLGIFSIMQWEINGAFIAAILTVVGYSMNDTIVIFDRIRENLRNKRKEDYEALVNRSILQSLNRSINTVLTCIFALLALLIFGGVTIKYFVIAMLIGFVVGTYSSIFVASPIWYELNKRY
ncbi:MAG TPA: protein translocase subunit SecF [Syntrophomonadaceae bacterium]|nr:protein translocase subunit SecF [Syntrophomonadaceae bacterium]